MSTAFSLSNPIIERCRPDAVVYNLTEPDHVTITLPIGSTWSSGLHWHETHTEYLRIVKGSVRVTLGDQEHTISAADATTEVRIDRNVWHEWRRADPDGDEDVVVVERTDPEDGQKAVFFWNLNGVLLKAQELACPPYMPGRVHRVLLDVWVTLNLFAIFRALDNVPVLVNAPRAFLKRGFVFPGGSLGHVLLRAADRVMSHLVLFLMSWIAWTFGIRPVRRDFTPEEVWEPWQSSRLKSKAA